MRGKVKLRMLAVEKDRITPAYAGKSHISEIFWIMNQDHPRLCGEKTDLNILTLDKLGSPPPMRGKATL